MPSRQAKWQAKKRAAGLCPVCGKKAYRAGRCRKHWKARLEGNRAAAARGRARVKKGLTDGLGRA